MSTLVRSQLLNSLREGVAELDEKIERAEYDISSFVFQFQRNGCLAEKRAELAAMHDERDALIAEIETREEEYDILWDLQCAISDATDIDGISDDALRSALKANGLEVRRKPNPNSPRERIAKIRGG